MSWLPKYHRAQFKARVYELLSHPGVLSEPECVDVLAEVINEMTEGELEDAKCVCQAK